MDVPGSTHLALRRPYLVFELEYGLGSHGLLNGPEDFGARFTRNVAVEPGRARGTRTT